MKPVTRIIVQFKGDSTPMQIHREIPNPDVDVEANCFKCEREVGKGEPLYSTYCDPSCVGEHFCGTCIQAIITDLVCDMIDNGMTVNDMEVEDLESRLK